MLRPQLLGLEAMSLGRNSEKEMLLGIQVIEQIFLEGDPASTKLCRRLRPLERKSKLPQQVLVVFVIV
jgi:hypothetical protein